MTQRDFKSDVYTALETERLIKVLKASSPPVHKTSIHYTAARLFPARLTHLVPSQLECMRVYNESPEAFVDARPNGDDEMSRAEFVADVQDGPFRVTFTHPHHRNTPW